MGVLGMAFCSLLALLLSLWPVLHGRLAHRLACPPNLSYPLWGWVTSPCHFGGHPSSRISIPKLRLPHMANRNAQCNHLMHHHFMHIDLLGLTVLVILMTWLVALCCRLHFFCLHPHLNGFSCVCNTFLPLLFAVNDGGNLYPDYKCSHPLAPERPAAALEQLITTSITSIIIVAFLSLFLVPLMRAPLPSFSCLLLFFSSLPLPSLLS